MTCESCATRKARPFSGAYSFRCVACCAALVLTAHPNKRLAAGHLAAIDRFRENPGRELVLECVRQELERRRSAQPKSGTD